MGEGQVKTGTTGKLDTSELRASLDDGPVAFFTTLAYGLRAGKAESYPLLPAKLLTKDLSGDTPYWRIEMTIEGATRALGFDLIGDAMIGRGIQADIDLDEYKALEKGVSRTHALLRPAKSQLYILDAGSKNGVWVNGVRLSRGQARTIESEFTLRMGGLNGTVQIIDHATLDELKKRVKDNENKGMIMSDRFVPPTIKPEQIEKPAKQDMSETTILDANANTESAAALRKAREQAKAASDKTKTIDLKKAVPDDTTGAVEMKKDATADKAREESNGTDEKK